MSVSRSVANRLQEAWNQADGQAFGAPFSADADFVTIRGELHHGREAIAGGHQGIFDSIYAGSSVSYDVLDARPLGDSAVLAHLQARLSVPAGPLAGTHDALATAVLVDGSDGVEIAAFHNTLVAAR